MSTTLSQPHHAGDTPAITWLTLCTATGTSGRAALGRYLGLQIPAMFDDYSSMTQAFDVDMILRGYGARCAMSKSLCEMTKHTSAVLQEIVDNPGTRAHLQGQLLNDIDELDICRSFLEEDHHAPMDAFAHVLLRFGHHRAIVLVDTDHNLRAQVYTNDMQLQRQYDHDSVLVLGRTKVGLQPCYFPLYDIMKTAHLGTDADGELRLHLHPARVAEVVVARAPRPHAPDWYRDAGMRIVKQRDDGKWEAFFSSNSVLWGTGPQDSRERAVFVYHAYVGL